MTPELERIVERLLTKDLIPVETPYTDATVDKAIKHACHTAALIGAKAVLEFARKTSYATNGSEFPRMVVDIEDLEKFIEGEK